MHFFVGSCRECFIGSAKDAMIHPACRDLTVSVAAAGE